MTTISIPTQGENPVDTTDAACAVLSFLEEFIGLSDGVELNERSAYGFLLCMRAAREAMEDNIVKDRGNIMRIDRVKSTEIDTVGDLIGFLEDIPPHTPIDINLFGTVVTAHYERNKDDPSETWVLFDD